MNTSPADVSAFPKFQPTTPNPISRTRKMKSTIKNALKALVPHRSAVSNTIFNRRGVMPLELRNSPRRRKPQQLQLQISAPKLIFPKIEIIITPPTPTAVPNTYIPTEHPIPGVPSPSLADARTARPTHTRPPAYIASASPARPLTIVYRADASVFEHFPSIPSVLFSAAPVHEQPEDRFPTYTAPVFDEPLHPLRSNPIYSLQKLANISRVVDVEDYGDSDEVQKMDNGLVLVRMGSWYEIKHISQLTRKKKKNTKDEAVDSFLEVPATPKQDWKAVLIVRDDE